MFYLHEYIIHKLPFILWYSLKLFTNNFKLLYIPKKNTATYRVFSAVSLAEAFNAWDSKEQSICKTEGNKLWKEINELGW